MSETEVARRAKALLKEIKSILSEYEAFPNEYRTALVSSLRKFQIGELEKVRATLEPLITKAVADSHGYSYAYFEYEAVVKACPTTNPSYYFFKTDVVKVEGSSPSGFVSPYGNVVHLRISAYRTCLAQLKELVDKSLNLQWLSLEPSNMLYTTMEEMAVFGVLKMPAEAQKPT